MAQNIWYYHWYIPQTKVLQRKQQNNKLKWQLHIGYVKKATRTDNTIYYDCQYNGPKISYDLRTCTMVNTMYIHYSVFLISNSTIKFHSLTLVVNMNL